MTKQGANLNSLEILFPKLIKDVKPVEKTSNDVFSDRTLRAKTTPILGTEAADSLQGTIGNDVIDGKGGDDVVAGLDGNDQLIGGTGNDGLWGGKGKDRLTGGEGTDVFIYTNKNEKGDALTDFSVDSATFNSDLIVVSALSFKGGLVAGTFIKPGQFRIGVSAKDKSDRFIYNSDTGSLSFDVDGSGTAKAFQLAKLPTNLALTNQNIFAL